MREAGEGAATPSVARRARRALGRIYRGWSRGVGRLNDACGEFLRWMALHVRSVLVRIKVRRKEILVMNCGENGEIDGLYAQFTVILGLLEHCEAWAQVYAGARVDFEDQGLYYDAAFGRNSWEYFFEPIDMGRESQAGERRIGLREQYRFAQRGEDMPRPSAHALISRHIHPKPHVQRKVDSFVRAHFAECHVIGIHYRGTDKWIESPRVPYEEVCAAVRSAIAAIESDRYRLFVATDEQGFLDCMLNVFGNKVTFWDTRRSVDGTPNWVDGENNYKKGEDAVIDCLLLSQCQQLIRTASSLGYCATLFNPAVPVVLVSRTLIADTRV